MKRSASGSPHSIYTHAVPLPPCSPPAGLPQHLRLLAPLQLAHVAEDAAVAHQQALGGLQSLLTLGTGCQQLAGPFPHPDLVVQLPLQLCVLAGVGRRMRTCQSGNRQKHPLVPKWRLGPGETDKVMFQIPHGQALNLNLSCPRTIGAACKNTGALMPLKGGVDISSASFEYSWKNL